jgi:CRP/FNR family transcriptional regulator
VSDVHFDTLARETLAAGFLATVPEESVQRLFEDAVRLDVPAGAVLYREGDRPRLALVLSGLIRIYLTAPDGRQVTVRYARRGEVLGASTAVAGPVDVSAQALVDAVVVVLNVRTLRELARSNATLAWAIAEEVSRRLYAVLEAFAGTAFGSVRQRVARHLLDVASTHQQGAALVAPLRQQELADAAGTVREVAARVLRDLRDAGLVETTRAGVRILDPIGLHAEAQSGNV